VAKHRRSAQAHSMLTVAALALAALAGGCDAAAGTASRVHVVRMETTAIDLAAGDTARLVATVTGGGTLHWSSSDAQVATVDESGLVTAREEGEVEVVATAGNSRGKAIVRVHPRHGGGSFTVTISPRELEVETAATAALSATVLDSKGKKVTDPTLTWASLNPNTAGVDSMGRVTGIAAGVALVTVAYSAAVDTARVTVQAPAPAPPPSSPPPPSGGMVGPAELPRVYLDTRYAAPQGRIVNVPAGGNLQSALDGAQRGDQIVLQAGATYTGNFVLPAKSGTDWIVIRTSGTLPAEGTRVTPAHAPQMARIVSPNATSAIRTAPGASHYRLMGLEVTYSPSVTQAYTLVALGDGGAAQNSVAGTPAWLIVDRSYVHGHPNVGFQRCIGLNSASSAVIDSWISECHHKGFDSQAIAGWNGPGPYRIVNNYLEGAGENVMFGGADTQHPDLLPSDIEIRRNHMAKPLAWRGVWSIKNLFEIKAGVRVLVEGNVFENNWADAQTGQAFVLKGDPARNARTQDLVVRYNVIRNSLSGVTLAPAPSGGSPMTRVYVGHNVWEQMGTASSFGSTGSARMWQLLDGLTDVVVEHNTARGGFNNAMIVEGTGKTRFSVRGNVTDQASYLLTVAAIEAQQIPASAFDRNVFVGSLSEAQRVPGNCYGSTITVPAECSGAGADAARVSAATEGVKR
jgi:hypothetical protein